jgi:hypothetical protein
MLVNNQDEKSKVEDDNNEESSSRASSSSLSAASQQKKTKKKSWFRPSAREAAFAGPPRYDWVDVETTAAVKIQSVARYVPWNAMDLLQHTCATAYENDKQQMLAGEELLRTMFLDSFDAVVSVSYCT